MSFTANFRVKVNHGMVKSDNLLTDAERNRLNASINVLNQECFFAAMTSLFNNRGYAPFSEVGIDPTFIGCGNIIGNFNNPVLKFNNTDCMSTDVVEEEFFHLFQRRMYAASSAITSANYSAALGFLEFEAYLQRDIKTHIKSPIFIGTGYNFALKNSDNTFQAQYITWLNTLTNNRTKWPTTIDFNTYKMWAERFAATNSKYKNFGYTFNINLPPNALISIVNESNCSK